MPIRIYNSTFDGCDIGISLPSDADAEMIGNQFFACGKAIDIRQPESILGFLGLKTETPPEVVKEVFAFMAESARTDQEITDKVTSCRLPEWLAAGANVTTLVQGLVLLYQNVPAILPLF